MTKEEKAKAEKIEKAKKVKEEKEAKLKAAAVGIKETKEVLQLAFAIGKIVKEAKANDGVFSSADLLLLANLFPHMGPAFEGMDKVVSELKDLDDLESRELLKFGAAHVGGVFDSKEMIEKIEAGLNLGLAVARLLRALK